MSYDEEIDKILTKAFDDIRKRVNTVLQKREKNILRDMKITTTSRIADKNKEKDREVEKRKEKKHKKHKKSSSSSSKSSSESD